MKPLVLLLTLSFLLAACGQTGPLYLPDESDASEVHDDEDEDDF